MELKIQLSDPGWEAFAVFYFLMQFVEIRSCKCLAYFRHTFDAFFHSFGCLKHRSGRAAAAVSVAVADQDIVVDVLVLVAVPSAHDGIRVQHSVVCGKEARLRLSDAERCDHMRENFASVDSFPVHGIVRHFVKLVPCQLCRHEVVDSAFFQNLRHGSGVSKDIRQPQDLVVHAELFFEKAFSEQELAHEGLS